jgi:signal transduction histidine kinase
MTSHAQLAGMEGDLKARLCEDFAFTLHAIAQPLTVLRGALGALSLRGASASDASRYVDLSNAQVERLCSLMSGMSMLLDGFQSEAICAPTKLWELINAATETEGCAARRSGPRISIAEVDHKVQILADPARAENAISAVLAAVSGASADDDEIHLTVDLSDGFADVTVHAMHADETKLTSIDRLRLMVAEASVRSQQGVFEFSSDPLHVSLKFPLHDQEEPGREYRDRFSASGRAR